QHVSIEFGTLPVTARFGFLQWDARGIERAAPARPICGQPLFFRPTGALKTEDRRTLRNSNPLVAQEVEGKCKQQIEGRDFAAAPNEAAATVFDPRHQLVSGRRSPIRNIRARPRRRGGRTANVQAWTTDAAISITEIKSIAQHRQIANVMINQ